MITAQDREIRALVDDIRDGRLLLPELQRGYVWKAPQVRNLFDSLYHNYPSGQLLIWETDDVPFSRAASVDELGVNQRRPQLLLDGQQRLTSLAAVMLGKPLRVRDLKRPIDIAFNVHTERFELVGPRQRGETGWISLTKLFTQGVMAIWMDLRLDAAAANAQQIYERLTRLDNIKTYKYRINVLENLEYDEVTDIFVRINSGGTTLGTADLALAQVSSRWRGVTKEFEAYQSQLWKQGLWLDTGLLLRAMALLLHGQSRLNLLFRGERRQILLRRWRLSGIVCEMVLIRQFPLYSITAALIASVCCQQTIS